MASPDGVSSRPDSAGAAVIVEVERDGWTLRVRLLGAGRPLLFLHGLGSDGTTRIRALGPLPGFCLALPDQRGHGSSTPASEPADFALDAMVADVAAIMNALEWRSAIVAGESMGAAVALAFALAHGERCEALVLCAPALGHELHPAAADFDALADRIDAIGVEATADEVRESLLREGRGLAEAEAAVAPWRGQIAGSLAAGMRSVPRWRPYLTPADLSRLRLPVALIAAAGDRWHPLELAETFAAHLPTSRLALLPGFASFDEPGVLGAAVVRTLVELGVVEARP